MKLNKIKQLKDGRYKIKLDNMEIITYDDVLLNNGLLYKKEIDEHLLNKILQEQEYYDIYNKALKYIAKRMRSKKEIKDYISKYELSSSDSDKIINKLIEIGLINDNLYTKLYIDDCLNLTNDGPYKIRNYLEKQNIDLDIIEEYLNSIDSNIIFDKAYKIISKRVKNNTKYSTYQLKQKIIIDLINLGYDKDLIINILDTFDYDENNNLLNDYNKLYKKLSIKYSGYELNNKIKQKLYAKGYDINKIKKITEE